MKITGINDSQRGLTLVELMIATVLGLFLIGGLLQIFIGSKQTYRMQEALSRLQENGRFAIDLLTRDIRHAGFKGCLSNFYPAMTPVLKQPTGFLHDFNTALQGFEAITKTRWTPAMVPEITSPLGFSDVITIRRADEQSFKVIGHTSDNAAGTSSLTLDNTVSEIVTVPRLNASYSNLTASIENLQAAGFLSTDASPVNNCAIAVVSNCETARVFQVSAIEANVLKLKVEDCVTGPIVPGKPGNPGNAVYNLTDNYAAVGEVRLINTVSYYVRKSDNGQPSLYRRIGANDAQELVEGVEMMEIFYGVDTDTDENAPGYGTANYYVKANAVKADDWATKVVSVRISLLLATIDNYLTDQPVDSFTFNGQKTTADRKLRRVFTSTIAVRNRVK